jgi:hypothetical protein
MDAVRQHIPLIRRHVGMGEHKISDVFPMLSRNPIMLDIFDDSNEILEVFGTITVQIIDRDTYMYVGNDDGTIFIGASHLAESEETVLYLDIIHELVHVKQHRRGLDLYDRSKPYVDRPTEIDAYILTVKEARRIGMTDEQIFEYLSVEWITPEEHKRLARRLNVRV